MTADAFDIAAAFDDEDAVTFSSFRFAEKVIPYVVRVVEDAAMAAEFVAPNTEDTAVLARDVRFVPFIDPHVAEQAWHRSVLTFAAHADINGIALGSTVYLQCPEKLNQWPLLIHEFGHVIQFHLQGRRRFLASYVLKYLKLRAQGLSDREAYLNLPAEVEARALESRAPDFRPRVFPYVTPSRWT
jgi:hypothetical protein